VGREAKHLDPEIMNSLASGTLPGTELPPDFFLHLIRLCPECSRAFETWRAGLGGRREPDSPEPTPEELRRLRRQLRALLRAPAEERPDLIDRASSWYRSPWLLEVLLEKSRDSMPEEPAQALHFANLAYLVGKRSIRASSMGLTALSAMHRANAFRASGKLREADELAVHARFLTREAGAADVFVLAEIDEYEGVLRKDQERFKDAEELLSRAAVRYRSAQTSTALARTLLSLGELLRLKPEPRKAIQIANEVLSIVDPISDRRLYLCARHNLALYLSEAGDLQSAREIFEENRPLYREFPDRWTGLRARWLEGRIARGLGDVHAAEEAFQATVDGFLALGIGYEAALAALDLADLYLEEGRLGDLPELAKSVAIILTAEDLHREAATAVKLFYEALGQKAVSEALVAHVRSYLQESVKHPGLRFDLDT
jgi:tetratricopeptide (TPR) repeat protein